MGFLYTSQSTKFNNQQKGLLSLKKIGKKQVS